MEMLKTFININNATKELEPWIMEHLVTALEWALGENTNEWAQIGFPFIMQNIFSHIQASKTKYHFLVNIWHGLSPFLNAKEQINFLQQFILTDQRSTNLNSFDIYWDSETDTIQYFKNDSDNFLKIEDIASIQNKPFVWTSGAKINKWLNNPQRPSFLVVGEDGSGKELLIRNSFLQNTKTSFVMIHCSANTSINDIEYHLFTNCIQTSNSFGKILKPKDKENLIICLKSPSLLRLDKYGVSMVLAFIEQILTYGGYYDKNIEWISLENIQFILSISSSSALSKFVTGSRVIPKLHILVHKTPDTDELNHIYSSFLKTILKDVLKPQQIDALTSTLVNTFVLIKEGFSIADTTNLSYSFTFRDLTKWICTLLRHPPTGIV